MAINTLNFLNKNQFRNYPIKAESELMAIDGKKITTELLVGCSISTTKNRRNLFIHQVTVSSNNISIVVAAHLDNGDFESLGIFSGLVVSDFTELQLSAFSPFVSGSIIIGSVEAMRALSGVYTFPEDALPLEESTIFYYTPPAVTSVVNNHLSLRGNVKFGVLNNLVKSRDGNNILFGVIDSASVASLADTHSSFNNCSTPVIRYVNGAVPFYDNSENYEDLQGNLFMVGVSPIVFYGKQGENTTNGENLPVFNGSIATGTVAISGAPLTLQSLCTTRNSVLPPISPTYIHNMPNDISDNPTFIGKKNYYSKSEYTPVNFIDADMPEFSWWPQFLKGITPLRPVTASQLSSATIGTAPVLTDTKKILAVTLINTGEAQISVTIKMDGLALPDYTEIILEPHRSTTIKGKLETLVVSGSLFTIYFNSVTGGNSFVQPYVFYR
jgi:hypothetical protein